MDPLRCAVHFFVYETIKIFLLLAVIVFVVAVLRSYLSPAKTRAILSHKRLYVGHVLAALLGTVTPFCSCSAVPLFIGFVEAGIPLGVTLSFLIASPMVNEVAVVLLWGLLGWKVALLYMASGLTVAIAAGLVVGRLKMERYLKTDLQATPKKTAESGVPQFAERLAYARGYTLRLLQRIAPYVLAGIGVGAFIHQYAPADWLARYAGRGNPFAVPVAVLLGIPLYSSAAGVIPIVQALMAKGLPVGTVLAFMMAVTALSFPEAVLLKKVLKMRLLLTFFGIVAASIIAVGYLFNALL